MTCTCFPKYIFLGTWCTEAVQKPCWLSGAANTGTLTETLGISALVGKGKPWNCISTELGPLQWVWQIAPLPSESFASLSKTGAVGVISSWSQKCLASLSFGFLALWGRARDERNVWVGEVLHETVRPSPPCLSWGWGGQHGSPRGLDILIESRFFIFQGESSSESSGWLHFKGELEAFRARIWAGDGQGDPFLGFMGNLESSINKGFSFCHQCQIAGEGWLMAGVVEPVNLLSPYFLLALWELSWVFISSSGVSGPASYGISRE